MCMNVPVAAAAKESHLKTSKVQKLRKIKWECSKHVGSKAVCYLNTLSLSLSCHFNNTKSFGFDATKW